MKWTAKNQSQVKPREAKAKSQKPKAKGQSEAKTKAKSQKPSEVQQITTKNFPGLKEKTEKK